MPQITMTDAFQALSVLVTDAISTALRPRCVAHHALSRTGTQRADRGAAAPLVDDG